MIDIPTDNDVKKAISGPPSNLCIAMTRYGSDKCSEHHNYTPVYNLIFGPIKDKQNSILEIGIGSVNPSIPSNMTGRKEYRPGASARGWSEYFKISKVYTCDIDRDILHFDEDRIYGFWLDQCNLDRILPTFLEDPKLKDVWFDVIIDDGLHDFHLNIEVMKRLILKVRYGGWYVIEDIHNFDPSQLSDFIYSWRYIRIPNSCNTSDNNILVVKKEIRSLPA